MTSHPPQGLLREAASRAEQHKCRAYRAARAYDGNLERSEMGTTVISHPEQALRPTPLVQQILIPIGVSSPKEATSPKGRGYPLRQNQILPRFRGWDMKQILNFTLPP
jgi:hypothetical protein